VLSDMDAHPALGALLSAAEVEAAERCTMGLAGCWSLYMALSASKGGRAWLHDGCRQYLQDALLPAWYAMLTYKGHRTVWCW